MPKQLHGIVNPAFEDTENETSEDDSTNACVKNGFWKEKKEIPLEKYVVHENGVHGLRYDLNDFDNVENMSEIPCKFYDPVFSSIKEISTKKWRLRSLNPKREILSESNTDSYTSKYSLMSEEELTVGAVKLWLRLPEVVKYDPALALFRQFYENENDNTKMHISLDKPMITCNVNTSDISDEDVNVVETEEIGGGQDKILDTETNDISKKSKVVYIIKICLLFLCWMFFTVVFMMYDETEDIIRNTSIAPGELKTYVLKDIKDDVNLLVTLSGPFLSEPGEKGIDVYNNDSMKYIEVWIKIENGNHSLFSNGSNQTEPFSEPWKIILKEENLDFSKGEPRTAMLKLPSQTQVPNMNTFALLVRSTSNQTIPFTINYNLSQLDSDTKVLCAFLLLCGLYILIIFEIINRTMAAMITSTASLAVLALTGVRPSLMEVVTWLDEETLLLLLSMMLLVSLLAETRIFDYLAVYTFQVTKGKIWPLVTLLCIITASVSTFLDNVTTVLLMTPVTIRLCEVMDMDPIPVLMSMVLYSNIGGAATPVGDPPNVIIASNKVVIQNGINFTNFSLHMTLGVILVSIQTYLQLRFLYRDTNKLRLNEPRDIQDLRHQISIWSRAAASLQQLSRDEQIVRETLEKEIQKLTAQLEMMVKESHKRGCSKDTFKTTLEEIKKKFNICDKWLLIKATVAVGFIVIIFLFHSVPEFNRLSLGWTALLGAILVLILADREDLEPILHRVEWSTLLFFAALFVLMEALSRLGLIEFIGGITESLILSVHESARLAVAILLMLWISGISSAFVDNIPLTTMMIRVVNSLASNNELNLPLAPLVWSLSFGACLGGNGTLIGASANVVCAGVADQHGYKFTFMQFFKIGFPIMIGHLIVASGYLLMCHCVFNWH